MLLSLIKYKKCGLRRCYVLKKFWKFIMNPIFCRRGNKGYKHVINAFFFRKFYFRTILMYLNSYYLHCIRQSDKNFFYKYNFILVHMCSPTFYYKHALMY